MQYGVWLNYIYKSQDIDFTPKVNKDLDFLPILVFLPSLLEGFSIIGMLKSWQLCFFGPRLFYLEGLSSIDIRSGPWQRFYKRHSCPINIACRFVLGLVSIIFFINSFLLSRCHSSCYIQAFMKRSRFCKKSNKIRLF